MHAPRRRLTSRNLTYTPLGASWFSSSGFLVTPAQLITAAVLAVVTAVVAFRLPRVVLDRPRRAVWPAAPVALLLASMFQATEHLGPDLVPAWVAVGVLLLLLAAAVAVSVIFRLDVLGLAIGAVLTYAWVGMTNAARADLTGVMEQIVIVMAAFAVAVLAAGRRHRPAPDTGSDPVSASGSDADAGAHARRQRATGAGGD